jgi:3-hydroxyacyl-CoA dehydrogenase
MLHAQDHPQAQFLWAGFRDLFHYSAFHLAAIAHNARNLDFAMRWGFGWEQGPFELWQKAGWQRLQEIRLASRAAAIFFPSSDQPSIP